MKRFGRMVAVMLLFSILPLTTAAFAEVKIIVDKSTQTLRVYEDGSALYTWDVSTGKKDSWTPNGNFGVQSMNANHFSSRYNNAPMPWSVFFNGNVAIHGTTAVRMLGNRDSHGYVRLHPQNAEKLYRLIQEHGPKAVTIKVQS